MINSYADLSFGSLDRSLCGRFADGFEIGYCETVRRIVLVSFKSLLDCPQLI